jgi:hypothetical protein
MKPLDGDPANAGNRRRRHGKGRIEGHQEPATEVLEAVGEEAGRQVGRLVEAGHRPEMRDPIETGEQGERLGQATIELRRRLRPRHARQPVPERLPVGFVIQEDGVAEIADLAPDQGVRPCLVPRQPADVLTGQIGGPAGMTGMTGRPGRRGTDRDSHDRTIPAPLRGDPFAANPDRRRRAYRGPSAL